MAVLPLRLSDDDIKALDALVKSGAYKNRGEAARALIRQGARLKTGEAPNVSGTVHRLLEERKKKGGRPFKISYSSKSTVELVAEGRGTLTDSHKGSHGMGLVSLRGTTR
jgi:Arc/MetJ-type ribon-helix-helix transcriptional regulator